MFSVTYLFFKLLFGNINQIYILNFSYFKQFFNKVSYLFSSYTILSNKNEFREGYYFFKRHKANCFTATPKINMPKACLL